MPRSPSKVVGIFVAALALASTVTAVAPAPAGAAGGRFSATGLARNGREFHTATLLHDGTVMVTGGRAANTTVAREAEVYNPTTGTWTVVGNMVAELGRSKQNRDVVA